MTIKEAIEILENGRWKDYLLEVEQDDRELYYVNIGLFEAIDKVISTLRTSSIREPLI